MTRLVWQMLCPVMMLALAFGCIDSRGSIHGTVYCEGGAPGSDLAVRAERPEYPGIVVRTDAGGRYELNNLKTGEWIIEFYDEDGWLAGLDTVVVRADETLKFDFTVGEKPLPEDVIPRRIIGAP